MDYAGTLFGGLRLFHKPPSLLLSKISAIDSIDIGLGLEDTHVFITGAASHIGSVTVAAFLALQQM